MTECPHDAEWFKMTEAEMLPYIMRHDCSNGCWNDIHRPRLELLKKCFGGLKTKIKPQDIDGTVERNGYFLFLEFKGAKENFEPKHGRKKTAADRYHEALTSQRRIIHGPTVTLSSPTATTVYIAGDSKTMLIEEIKVIYDGKHQEWEACDLYGLQRLCWEWYEWTEELADADRDRARNNVRAIGPHPFLART